MCSRKERNSWGQWRYAPHSGSHQGAGLYQLAKRWEGKENTDQ